MNVSLPVAPAEVHQTGLREVKRIRQEAPIWSTLLPEVPRLVHRYLNTPGAERLEQRIQELIAENRQQNMLLAIIAVALTALVGLAFYFAL